MTHADQPLEQMIRDVLAATQSTRFADGFAERSVARWHARRLAERSVLPPLSRQFRRLAVASVAATVLLALYNVSSSTGAGPLPERVLGIAPVTLEAAYALSVTPTP